MTRFTFREADCPDCFEGRYEIASGPGYVSCRCETCDGIGDIEATCDECAKAEPLNDDGLCERCVDASTLPLAEFQAKYRPAECLVAEPLSELRSPEGRSHAA